MPRGTFVSSKPLKVASFPETSPSLSPPPMFHPARPSSSLQGHTAVPSTSESGVSCHEALRPLQQDCSLAKVGTLLAFPHPFYTNSQAPAWVGAPQMFSQPTPVAWTFGRHLLPKTVRSRRICTLCSPLSKSQRAGPALLLQWRALQGPPFSDKANQPPWPDSTDLSQPGHT